MRASEILIHVRVELLMYGCECEGLGCTIWQSIHRFTRRAATGPTDERRDHGCSLTMPRKVQCAQRNFIYFSNTSRNLGSTGKMENWDLSSVLPSSYFFVTLTKNLTFVCVDVL